MEKVMGLLKDYDMVKSVGRTILVSTVVYFGRQLMPTFLYSEKSFYWTCGRRGNKHK